MWFDGMQIPVLLVVLEYAILLALTKFCSYDRIELKETVIIRGQRVPFLKCGYWYFCITYNLAHHILMHTIGMLKLRYIRSLE